LSDPRILEFIGRIDAGVDPEIEGMGPEFRHAARVKVRARDGRAWEKLLLHRRGSPEHPLAPADVEHKFRHVVNGCLSQGDADKVLRLTNALDRLDDLSELMALLGKNSSGASAVSPSVVTR
jgi:2-methylcitrate dehydratase PrpD